MRTQITLPPIEQDRPARIVQLSDFHLFEDTAGTLLGVNTHDALEGVLAHIRSQPERIDLVLATGDISQDGTAQSYRHAQQLLQQLSCPVIFSPGNHDDLAAMREVLGAQMPTVADLASWRVVSLDSHVAGSDEGFLAEDQFALLSAAAHTQQWVLVSMHHNPVPMGSAWLDPMMIANAPRLLSLCEEHDNVQGLLWGHVHQEMDTVQALGAERRQLRLLACPATCLQFGPRSATFALDTVDPGYRVLDLYPDGSMHTSVVRVPGLEITPDLSSRGY